MTREAIGQDGALLRYTPMSEVYDEASRTRITTTRYERLTPVDSESVEREWILHWYTSEQFREMCSEVGLRVTRVLDKTGESAAATATEFTVIVRR